MLRLLLWKKIKMELRVTAVSKFEQFLAKYPTKAQGAEIRFQLAEIYFDEAEEMKLIEEQKFKSAFR